MPKKSESGISPRRGRRDKLRWHRDASERTMLPPEMTPIKRRPGAIHRTINQSDCSHLARAARQLEALGNGNVTQRIRNAVAIAHDTAAKIVTVPRSFMRLLPSGSRATPGLYPAVPRYLNASIAMPGWYSCPVASRHCRFLLLDMGLAPRVNRHFVERQELPVCHFTGNETSNGYAASISCVSS